MVLHLHRANLSTLFPTASEDALQELCAGHQLGSSNRWGSRKRDRSGGVRHPNEWRTHGPWLRGGRGSPHEPEGHRSFQHAESAAQPPRTPQLQSGQRSSSSGDPAVICDVTGKGWFITTCGLWTKCCPNSRSISSPGRKCSSLMNYSRERLEKTGNGHFIMFYRANLKSYYLIRGQF